MVATIRMELWLQTVPDECKQDKFGCNHEFRQCGMLPFEWNVVSTMPGKNDTDDQSGCKKNRVSPMWLLPF